MPFRLYSPLILAIRMVRAYMAFAKQMDKSRAFNSGRFSFRLHVQHVHYSITLKSTAMKKPSSLLPCCNLSRLLLPENEHQADAGKSR